MIMQKIQCIIFSQHEITFFNSKTHKTCYTDSKLKTALIPFVGKIHVCFVYKTYAAEKLMDLLHS